MTFDVLPEVSTATSGALPDYGPVLGDFDGDGILDFVGPTGLPARMGLLLGVGDGTFHAKPVEPASAGFWRAAAADLNEDGRLDLASISGDDAIVTVRMGNGDPSTIFAESTTYPTSSPPSSLVLADLDGDGRVDLVAGGAKDATTGKPYLRSWRGSASGMLATPVDLSVGAVGSFLVATDWNQDGVLDLLFGTFSLRILLGRGDGSFAQEVACGLALAEGSSCNVIADFDGDQRPDVALCSIGVLLGMTGCNFRTLVSLPGWQVTPALGGQRADVAASADLNGDDALDIVSQGYHPNDVPIAVYAGDGRGGFAAPRTFSVVEGQPNGTIVAGDLNRDGRLDLLVTRSGGWQVLLNTCR